MLDARALALGTFVPMLRNLVHVLDKGEKHENAGALPEARLAEDMYPLHQQVQLACFHARDAEARLAGRAPSRADNEVESMGALKARVESTIAHLEKATAFDGDRAITIPLPDGGARFEMTGYELLQEWSIPHFYFHVVTAYDILRREGVPLGKQDYLGSVAVHLRH